MNRSLYPFARLLHTLYPAFCVYCAEALESPTAYLCAECIPKMRFAYHLPRACAAYCFEQENAGAALLEAFERTQFSRLKKVLVSLMIMQWFLLEQEMPDLIVPAVQKNILAKNSVNVALARTFSTMIQKPVLSLLTFRLDDSVYDRKGQLMGAILMKPSTEVTLPKDGHILIVDSHGYFPTEHKQPLIERGCKRVSYLSFCNRSDLT